MLLSKIFSKISILDTLLGKPSIKDIVSDLMSSPLIEADWSNKERASLTDPPDTLTIIWSASKVKFIFSSSQTHLRWSIKTPTIHNHFGFNNDSSVGYADYVGFRSGTSHEYSMFDFSSKKKLDVKQNPLIFMQRTHMCNAGDCLAGI